MASDVRTTTAAVPESGNLCAGRADGTQVSFGPCASDYLECAGGNPIHRLCQGDTVFSQTRRRCVPITQVPRPPSHSFTRSSPHLQPSGESLPPPCLVQLQPQREPSQGPPYRLNLPLTLFDHFSLHFDFKFGPSFRIRSPSSYSSRCALYWLISCQSSQTLPLVQSSSRDSFLDFCNRLRDPVQL